MSRSIGVAFVAASLAALTACGGGGMDSETQDAAPTAADTAQGRAEALQVAAAALPTPNCTPLAATSVIAKGNDGNVPENTLDGRLDTRWSNLGKGSWIDYDLGSQKSVAGVSVAWHQGASRTNNFSISTSPDGMAYTTVYTGKSSGTTVNAETYAFNPHTTRRVRITVNGNSLNDWASIAEARVCAGPGAPSTVVWRADFETGDISQWSSSQKVSADRLAVVTSPVAQGRYALKATVRQGDDPINASGNRNELVKMTNEPAGSEYYYHWNTMFDSSFPSEKHWQLFTQWHHSGGDGSPPVEFYVYGEEMRLNIGGSPGTQVWQAPLERGKWKDFVFHVKWSSDPKVGFVELYVDRKLVLPKRYIATQFKGQVNYLKVGLYRDERIQPVGVVFHDNWIMGKSLDDVIGSGLSTRALQDGSSSEAQQ